ncbi:MAG: hypothetical protein HN509_06870 [Halobacteriovoraceae bacterium]|jgi:hypothetical protein|nr:hypothetical protein [Halobacteriovoraceae bacterium]MBT5093108.1 hypothetical protein [Halobacteriovoraceae bacterium]
MKEFFKTLPAQKFKAIAVTVCLIGDLSYITYLYGKFSDHDVFMKAFSLALSFNKAAANQFPPNFAEDMFKIMLQSLTVMMALLLIFHIAMYAVYIADKAAARAYLLALTWVSGPGTILMALMLKMSFSKLHFGILGLAYIFVAYGLLQYPNLKKKV